MAALTLEPVTLNARTARQFVVAELARAGLAEDIVDTAELLVSELVTNALMHAQTEIVVRVCPEGGPMIEVQDKEPRLPLRRTHDPESVTGRGLELVRLLAAAHGVRIARDGGKIVWFALGRAVAPAGISPVTAPDGARTREARLLNVPVVLFDVMREHSESLLREFAVQRLREPRGIGLSAHDISAADAARTRIAEAVTQGIAQAVAQALAEGSRAADDRPAERVDVQVLVRAEDAAAMRILLDAFSQAHEMATTGVLLTRPALPEVRALREWCARELIDQAAGASPRPWTDNDDDDDDETEPGVRATSTYDGGWLKAGPGAVVVGDASNRITAVSPAAARLLGWAPESLLGRRLTTIVPPSLRHAHLAGFTRQLATARPHLIGKPLDLMAWHRGGYEVPVTLLLGRHAGPDGPLFTAHLAPRAPEPSGG